MNTRRLARVLRSRKSLMVVGAIGLGEVLFAGAATWGLFGQLAQPVVPPVVAAAAADDSPLPLPDSALTPGAVVPGYRMMCAPPYAPPRTWHDKRGTLSKYGYPASMAPQFEDDDRVPVCAGGDNANPLNHGPQACDRWVGTRCVAGLAHEKDLLEARVCKAICAGKMSLEQGQAIFLGDWRLMLGVTF